MLHVIICNFTCMAILHEYHFVPFDNNESSVTGFCLVGYLFTNPVTYCVVVDHYHFNNGWLTWHKRNCVLECYYIFIFAAYWSYGHVLQQQNNYRPSKHDIIITLPASTKSLQFVACSMLLLNEIQPPLIIYNIWSTRNCGS